MQDFPNLLPYDGGVHYFPNLFSAKLANVFFDELLSELQWEHDIIQMFGKRIVTQRKVAWYGDKSYSYTYSKSTKTALPWTDTLMTIKNDMEKKTGTSFNSCLANLYMDGTQGMGWHSDNEKELLEDGPIASVSLGAARKFVLRHNATKEKVELILENGSLLLMKGVIQKHWQHRLPPTKKVDQPRINLTFRTIV